MNRIQEIIEKLQLEPHPEGGYYRQVYGNDENGKKSISTIYYMLDGANFSAFHRLHGMTEIWYFHEGEPLDIHVIDTDGSFTTHHLSADGEMQAVLTEEQWFAAEIPSKTGFCLVGCAVAPAFEFEKFELGKKEELIKSFPNYKDILERLCK